MAVVLNNNVNSPNHKTPNSEPVPRDHHNLPDDGSNGCSLFVGDLARAITEDQLFAAFSKHGTVKSVDIKRDKITQNNLGYGFVQFKNKHEAEVAKIALDGAEIANRRIRLGWAQKNTNLFVGDLDSSITSEKLRNIFRKFGPIFEEETFVKKNKYGFVRFKHRAHAERAKSAMDGKMIGSRAVRIGWGDTNTQRNCVHVQFDSSLVEVNSLLEEDFRRHFCGFGHIVKVSLPRYPDRRLKGYGFIHYNPTEAGEAAAARAITSLSGSSIGIISIQCNFGKRQGSKKKRNYRPNYHRNHFYTFDHVLNDQLQMNRHSGNSSWSLPPLEYPSMASTLSQGNNMFENNLNSAGYVPEQSYISSPMFLYPPVQASPIQSSYQVTHMYGFTDSQVPQISGMLPVEEIPHSVITQQAVHHMNYNSADITPMNCYLSVDEQAHPAGMYHQPAMYSFDQQVPQMSRQMQLQHQPQQSLAVLQPDHLQPQHQIQHFPQTELIASNVKSDTHTCSLLHQFANMSITDQNQSPPSPYTGQLPPPVINNR